jgi:YNFM family putative membrane transporter
VTDKPVAATLERGTPAFRRANWALFLAAFSMFGSLYSVQPLLPIFVTEYGVRADESSLALSLTSAVLGIFMVFAGALSDAAGRKRLMVTSLWLTAMLNFAVMLAPSWNTLLVARTLLGLVLCGVPSVAMAYIAEEVDPRSLSFAMGLYIGGTAIGGMVGRILLGVMADLASWRLGMGVFAALVLASAISMQRLLPESRHFVAKPFEAGQFLPGLGRLFTDPGLRWLYAEAFLLMGSFVTVFNYISFRLSAAPYSLSHTLISFLFLSYVIGSGSSAWAGGLADRVGRRKVLWWMVLTMVAGLALISMRPLVAVAAGAVVLAFGFFGSHTITSSWVGRRALGARAQASSLYLLFYYMGASFIGTAGGWFWSRQAWPGVAMLVAASLILALAVAIRLFFLPPLPIPETRSSLVPAP